MEKAYDRVNKKKLFELMRDYGVHLNLVGLIGRIYNDSMVLFAVENMTTGWCKGDFGVRQYWPWSPLLFNIYIRELEKLISNCAHGVKYAVMGKDCVMECKNQAGFLYADGVRLMASSEGDIKYILEQVKECVK